MAFIPLSPSYLASALLIIFGTLYVRSQAGKKIDPREPIVVPSTIPYIGHLLGMIFQGSRYFKKLGRENQYPIFTLPSLNSRLYIVTDPSLAASVQRASKTLSFNPIVPPILRRVPGMDKATTDLIESDMVHGFVQTVQERVHTNLAQGEYLDELTLQACNEFLVRLNQVGEEAESVDLLRWVKHIVTISTANFFYGPNNPIERDPQLINQFWDFDAGIPGLLIGVLPWLTARKAYKGREAVVQALSKYLVSPEYEEAAHITKERTEVARRFDVDQENTARSDLTFFFAGIINTSLTSFWMILHIFAQPDLLVRIRSEIEAAIDINDISSGRVSMSIRKVVKQCNLLNAVFKEVLRLYSDNFATRVVLSDTLLADTYFLRAGSIVQISGGIIHGDHRIWGTDVDDFRPDRFLNGSSGLMTEDQPGTNKQKSIHPAAFRAFGGGATLCPGRHFALNEILGFVAMVIFMLEIKPAGEKPLHVPRKADDVVPIHVLEPQSRVHVKLAKRVDFKADLHRE